MKNTSVFVILTVMSEIVPIGAITDIDKVGSLGSYLTILSRAGVRIAEGFIIPTGTVLKDGLSNEILRAFDQLKCSTVTLRSAPLSHEVSGETIRTVRRDALVDAVRYLLQNILHRGRKAAIVVQKDLRAEFSGVAYSYNPTTNNRREALIEAYLWMNETVLSGENEPDVVLINKNTGTLSYESEEEDELCLTPRQFLRVYQLLRRVERYANMPISLDWALDNNVLYALNVRPLTEKIKKELF